MSISEARTLNEISRKLESIKAMLDAEAQTKRKLSQIAAEKCCMLVPGISEAYRGIPTALLEGSRLISVRSVDPHSQTVECAYWEDVEVPKLFGGTTIHEFHRTITLPAFAVQPYDPDLP